MLVVDDSGGAAQDDDEHGGGVRKGDGRGVIVNCGALFLITGLLNFP